MKKNKITMTDVADRLEEAVLTLRRLPKVKVQGYGSSWPDVVHSFHEAYGYNDATVRLGPPSARSITEMDEALTWLLSLTKEEVILVWLRASGARWKTIERKLGWGITKLKNDYTFALCTIVDRLNISSVKRVFPYRELLNS